MKPELVNIDYPDISFEEEFIRFHKNRTLSFEIDAFSHLWEELIQSLGKNIARSALSRFGYKCGINDVNAYKRFIKFNNDPKLILAGPKIHTLRGIVHATCEELKLSDYFYMSGIWRDSYEAKYYQQKYGKAKEPVCWSLTGYASAFGTGILGHEVYCVETMCQAMGDPYCRFEIRHVEDWKGEADQIIRDLKQNAILKSLQLMLDEERVRTSILGNLSKSIIDIGLNIEPSNMLVKIVGYARRLFNVEKAFIVIKNKESKRITLYETFGNEDVLTGVFSENNEVLSYILNYQQPVVWNNYNKILKIGSHNIKIKNLLCASLRSKNEALGALLLINKINNSHFTLNDYEFLTLLAAQSSIALGNALSYEETNKKLQEKVSELYTLNNLLSAEHNALQKSTQIHKQLTSLVLEGHGLDTITESLSKIVNRPVLVADNEFRIISNIQNCKNYLNITQLWQTTLQKISSKEMISLSEGIKVIINHNDDLNLVIIPIIAGKDKLGFVATIEKDYKLNQMEHMAMEQAGTVIALELLKQKVAFETEHRLRKDFLNELLNGNQYNKEAIIRRAKHFGLELSKTYWVIAMEFIKNTKNSYLNSNDTSITGSFFQTLERDIKQISKNLILIGNNKYIVGLLSANNNAEKDTTKGIKVFIKFLENLLNTHYSDYTWRIGISSPTSDVLNFTNAYKEACITIEIIKSLKLGNKCKSYERLGVFGLLNINLEQFNRFINHIIGPLLEYDKKHNTQLVETLSLYYKSNCNLQRAARLGFLNPSTLKYRLKRITEIAGIDLGDPETNLLMHLALKIIEGL